MNSILANVTHVVSLLIAIFFIYMLVGLFITFLICAALDYIKIKNKSNKSYLREQALFYYIKKYKPKIKFGLLSGILWPIRNYYLIKTLSITKVVYRININSTYIKNGIVEFKTMVLRKVTAEFIHMYKYIDDDFDRKITINNYSYSVDNLYGSSIGELDTEKFLSIL